jgi:benzodiazapine receptor
MQKSPSPWLVLAVFLVVNVIVSGIGGAITSSSVVDWYPTLAKPAFNPPDWLFGPVWTLLYVVMAVAAWRVWRQAGWRAARGALLLYFVQLGANLAWSALFFGLRRPDLALVDCLLLLGLVLVTALAFRRHDRSAALLMVPYLLWVGFACVLNGSIVALN